MVQYVRNTGSKASKTDPTTHLPRGKESHRPEWTRLWLGKDNGYSHNERRAGLGSTKW